MSALWSSALSSFRPALHSHRMFFLSSFALFWTDLQQPGPVPCGWKAAPFFFFFFNSVWIRALLSPAALFLSLFPFAILTYNSVLVEFVLLKDFRFEQALKPVSSSQAG